MPIVTVDVIKNVFPSEQKADMVAVEGENMRSYS